MSDICDNERLRALNAELVAVLETVVDDIPDSGKYLKVLAVIAKAKGEERNMSELGRLRALNAELVAALEKLTTACMRNTAIMEAIDGHVLDAAIDAEVKAKDIKDINSDVAD